MNSSRKYRNLILLFSAQKGKCFYCNICLETECVIGITPQIDHKLPKCRGGNNHIDNLCLTCRRCNNSKGSKNEIEFKAYLQPFLDKKLKIKELSEFYRYKQLKNKFKNIN